MDNKNIAQVPGGIKAAPTARLGLPPSRVSPDFLSPDFPHEMRCLVPAIAGNRLEIEIKVLKFIEDLEGNHTAHPPEPRARLNHCPDRPAGPCDGENSGRHWVREWCGTRVPSR
jgi:hypothetical protein